MKNKDFTTAFLTVQTPAEVFKTILNVRKWWFGLHSEKIEGDTDKLNGEFTFRAGNGMHYSKQKLVELIPNKKIVWLVTDSKLTFLKNESEWNGTRIVFDITEQGDKTEVRFTHQGLVPGIECYGGCSKAWSQYIDDILRPQLTAGK